MSALPSPLKSPVPAMLQDVGSVGKLAPYASVVPFMIQITRSPVMVFCQMNIRFAVPVKVARTSDAPVCRLRWQVHSVLKCVPFMTQIERSPVMVFCQIMSALATGALTKS